MKTNQLTKATRRGEQGNVLFLILIAVALFAALSYAVTQSTRSGGGDATKEKSLVSSAALTQYPASIKTAIVRMTVSNGIDVNFLDFDKPATFSVLDDSAGNKMKKNAVFYPDPGGGATYSDAPAEVVTTAPAAWVFNANNEVANIGTTSATAAATAPTADVIAFLKNMQKSVCDKIHSQLGMGAVATTPAFAVNLTNMQSSTISASTGGILATTGVKITGTVFDGQPQGCFYKDATDGYIYYHVLVER